MIAQKARDKLVQDVKHDEISGTRAGAVAVFYINVKIPRLTPIKEGGRGDYRGDRG